MKRRSVTFLRKYGPAIWLVTAVVLLMVAVSFGAYTNFNKVRRVVSAQNDRILFSSNLLYPEKQGAEEKDYRNRTMTQPGGNTISFQISVYNYDIANEEIWNSHSISYTLKVTLKPHEDVTLTEDTWNKFKVSSGNTSNSSTNFIKGENTYYQASLSSTLSNVQASTDIFTFTVPKEAVNAVDLVVEALPDNISYRYTDNKKLAAVISIGDMTASKGWTGKIIDDRTGERRPNDYGGFNYEISGTGEGTITLIWDPSLVEISPWFSSAVTGTVADTSDGKKTLTFLVGGTDQPSAYQTQFYKASGWSADTGWDTLDGAISVSYTETSTEGIQ